MRLKQSKKMEKSKLQEERFFKFVQRYETWGINELIAEKEAIASTPGWVSSKGDCLGVLCHLIEEKKLSNPTEEESK